MKRKIKLLLTLFVFYALITITKSVDANTASKITMDINLDNFGDAIVTETWKCEIKDGTENSHLFKELGNAKIKDLSVREGSTKYTRIYQWDKLASKEKKNEQCAIINSSNGTEICWGIGEYGEHNYIINYTIENFATELNDANMININLIPPKMLNKIDEVNIKIRIEKNIDNTVQLWQFGNKKGKNSINTSYLEITSNGINGKDYLTVLVKFPKKLFNLKYRENNSIQYYYDKLTKEEKDHNSIINMNALLSIFKTIIKIACIFGIYIVTKFILRKKKIDQLILLNSKSKINKEIDIFKNVIENSNFYEDYFIANLYKISKNKTDIFSSIIFKWLTEFIITIETADDQTTKTKDNTIIILNKFAAEKIEDYREKELFYMLVDASQDGSLTALEFEEWCKNEREKVLSWYKDVFDIEMEKMVENDNINLELNFKVDGFKFIKVKTSDYIKTRATQLAGIKKYILNYSIASKGELMNAETLEYFIIYAQMLGVLNEEVKQFKEIHSQIIKQTSLVSYEYVLFTNEIIKNGIQKAKKIF